MSRVKAQDRIRELEAQLAKSDRDFSAIAEWFRCVAHKHATVELDVLVGGDTALRVEIHGISRAGGGVAVVHSGDYADLPRWLDDVISEWSNDSAPEIREAAKLMRAKREEYCKA